MNLVGEANKCVYDFARFPRVCTDCAFLDHGVPTLSQMQIFCQTVDAFLAHVRVGEGLSDDERAVLADVLAERSATEAAR